MFTSTNAAPAYGRQYIRFAETFTADPAVAIGEFRAVSAGAQMGTCTLPGATPTSILGVNQAFIPLFADAPASPRPPQHHQSHVHRLVVKVGYVPAGTTHVDPAF